MAIATTDYLLDSDAHLIPGDANGRTPQARGLSVDCTKYPFQLFLPNGAFKFTYSIYELHQQSICKIRGHQVTTNVLLLYTPCYKKTLILIPSHDILPIHIPVIYPKIPTLSIHLYTRRKNENAIPYAGVSK